MLYFKSFWTVAVIKTKYRELAKLFHPDKGGDKATMQQINAEYHEALKGKHKSKSTDPETGKEHTYYYNQALEQELMDKLRHILGIGLPDDVTIELVGTWIWVSGNTKPHKDKLGSGTFKDENGNDQQGVKCLWHSKRKMWYWRKYQGKTYYSGASFDRLRACYGSETNFRKDEQVA